MRFTSLASRRTATAAATLSLAAAGIAGVALAPAASAAAATLSLSAVSGPSGGTNTITATATANTFLSGTGVLFVYKTTTSTACPTTYGSPSGTLVPATSAIHVLTAKKLAVTVPAGVALSAAPAGATSAAFLLCTYTGTGTSAAVTGTAPYTVAAAPTVSSVSPVTGASLGGGTITLTGTNFTSTTTAMIGSAPLTGITFIDSTHISGTVPAQAAGAAMSVTATSVGGSGSLPTAYTYSNGIEISPATAPTATAATDVDVQGVGFSSLTFSNTTGATPNHASGHVFLTAGAYDPTDNSGAKTKGQTGECLNVLPISDTELICTVNTLHADGASGSAIPNGTYTLAVVSSGAVAAQAVTGYSQSIISSGSTFTVAPY